METVPGHYQSLAEIALYVVFFLVAFGLMEACVWLIVGMDELIAWIQKMLRRTSNWIWIKSSLKDKLQQLADNDGQTLSGYVLKVLQEHVEQYDKIKRK